MDSERRSSYCWLIGLAVVVVAGLTAVFPFLGFILNPVSVLLSCDPALIGSEVYIDGKHVMTIRRTSNALHFQRGTHEINVKSDRYGSDSVVFKATDSEQGSRTIFILRKKGKHLDLAVE